MKNAVIAVALVTGIFGVDAKEIEPIRFHELKRAFPEKVKTMMVLGTGDEGSKYIQSFGSEDDRRSNSDNWRGAGTSAPQIASSMVDGKYTRYTLVDGRSFYTWSERDGLTFRIHIQSSNSGISGIASTSDKSSPYSWIIHACSKRDMGLRGGISEAINTVLKMCG